MRIAIAGFEPLDGASLEEQVVNCQDQLENFLGEKSLCMDSVIAMNFFLSAVVNGQYKKEINQLKDILTGTVKTRIPRAFLAQAPAGGALVSLEAYYLPEPGEAAIEACEQDGYPYLVIKDKQGEKLVVANGIGMNSEGPDITGDAERVFSTMDKILRKEDLDFGKIFRQWNYIEDIVRVEEDEKMSQHYQEFNNVRAAWYGTSKFQLGYPAATGIGTRAGGVIVSFFAASKGKYRVIPIENPLQKAAFDYTDKVLVGDAEYKGGCKCTPKFSRAKWVASEKSCQVYISGTASIRNELTVAEGDVSGQTEVTIDNILQLVSRETLCTPEQQEREAPLVEFIRVYIKFPQDFEKVKEVCDKMLPGVPAIYVISDVCRDNLLVEIEALATA